MSAQTQSGHVPPVDGPGDPVVTVERLTKRYSQQIAVDDLTFSLDRGMITDFLGPDGAGKSTTLRLLLVWLHPGRDADRRGRGHRADADHPAGTQAPAAHRPRRSPGSGGTHRHHQIDPRRKESDHGTRERRNHLRAWSSRSGRLLGTLGGGRRSST